MWILFDPSFSQGRRVLLILTFALSDGYAILAKLQFNGLPANLGSDG